VNCSSYFDQIKENVHLNFTTNQIKKNNIMSTGKVFLGVLVGAAAGAVLGVLFAPAKGSAVRKEIYKKGESETDSLKEKFNAFVDAISEKFDKTKKDVADYEEQEKTNAEEVEKEIKANKR
jgi:gas vesicle protein